MTVMERIRALPQVAHAAPDNAGGVWAYLQPGWSFGSDSYGALHRCCDRTATALLRRVRQAERCGCCDCLRVGGAVLMSAAPPPRGYASWDEARTAAEEWTGGR